MKAAIYEVKVVGLLKEIPEYDIPNSDYVKVKIEYCNICATDVHIVTDGLYNLPTGRFVLGHESTGTIVEVGDGARSAGFDIGNRVAIGPMRACGYCYYCRNSQVHYCENLQKNGIPGGMAEYTVAHKANLFHIPDEVSFKEAAILEPLSSVMHGFDLTAMKSGTRVVISGAGGIGLLHLILAKRSGAASITVIEPIPEKRQLAIELGANHVIDPINEDVKETAMKITNGRGYDYVFEASGVPAAAPPCLQIVANQGTITYFAVFPGDYDMPLNLYHIYDKEVTIHAVWAYQNNFERAMQLIPSIREEISQIISKEYPLAEVSKAFNEAKGSVHPKITIKC